MQAQRRQIDHWNGGPTVQCYSQVGSRLISKNTKYVLDESDRNLLYAAPGAAGPQPGTAFEKTGSKSFSAKELGSGEGPVSFESYKGKFELKDADGPVNPNDCGMYANALARGLDSWTKEELVEKKKVGRRQGLSNPEDRYRAATTGEGKQQASRDRYDVLDKDNQESYLAMNVGDVFELYFENHVSEALKNGGECSHHAAAVVAVDAEDQITHEANAGTKLKAGRFFMYGKAKEQQFYTKNIREFDWKKAKGTVKDTEKAGILDRLIKEG